MQRDDLFWSKVDTSNTEGCWPYRESVDDEGYGRFWDGERMVGAHRYAFGIRGKTPGQVIDHLCHNESDCVGGPCEHRRCCNPAHLELCTQKENCERGRGGAHHRSKTHCPQGHEYTPENTMMNPRSDGGTFRACRECRRVYNRKYHAARAA